MANNLAQQFVQESISLKEQEKIHFMYETNHQLTLWKQEEKEAIRDWAHRIQAVQEIMN